MTFAPDVAAEFGMRLLPGRVPLIDALLDR